METITEALKKEKLLAFLIAHYKYNRLQGRGKEYVQALLDSRFEDSEVDGIDLISEHESKSGEGIWYKFCTDTNEYIQCDCSGAV